MLKPRILRLGADDFGQLHKNAPFQFAQRYALSIYCAETVFSFIPKNACSTMRYSVGLANGLLRGPQDINWIATNNVTFKASLSDLARAKYCFTVLRDPYRRLASCFLDKFVDKNQVAMNFRAMAGIEVGIQKMSFRMFVAALEPHLRGDEHWQPQLDYMIYETYDDYFCVEDMDKTTRVLEQKIGFAVQDARQISRHGTDQFRALEDEVCYADAEVRKLAALKAQGAVPKLEQFYDAALAAEAGRLYAGDVMLYREKTGRDCLFAP